MPLSLKAKVQAWKRPTDVIPDDMVRNLLS